MASSSRVWLRDAVRFSFSSLLSLVLSCVVGVWVILCPILVSCLSCSLRVSLGYFVPSSRLCGRYVVPWVKLFFLPFLASLVSLLFIFYRRFASSSPTRGE